MAHRPDFVPPRALAALLALGLVLRLVVFLHGAAVHPRVLHPNRAAIEAALTDPQRPFVSAFGFEASNVAWALVCGGEGFASPFGGATGPTGWVSPGLVAPWALAFALFGCFSRASVLALFTVAGVASLAVIALGALTAGRLFRSGRAGLAAGVLLAVSPWDLAVFHAESLLDPNLTAAAALALAALLVRIADRPTVAAFAGFGALAGVAVLINPALGLPAACGLGVAVAGRSLRRAGAEPGVGHGAPALAGPARTAGVAFALAAAGQLLLVGPWVLHQHGALGGWSLVKTNLPFEVALGNREGVDGVYDPQVFAAFHPSVNAKELARYRRLGERAYVAERFAAFRARFDPLRFIRATGRRAAHALFLPTPRPWQGPWSRRVHALMAPIPGLALLLYPLLAPWARRRLAVEGQGPAAGGRTRGDGGVYTVAAAYLLPYLVTGVTERYLLPLVPLVLVLAAGPLAARFRSAAGKSERRTRTVSSGRDDGPNRAPSGSGRFS